MAGKVMKVESGREKLTRRVNFHEERQRNGKHSLVDIMAQERGHTSVAVDGGEGVYIPPFKLARIMEEIEDKSSDAYQRLTWDALRKSINGLLNKVNVTNIKNIIPELFFENLIRGRELFNHSCMKSQMVSPSLIVVFSAIVAILNAKFSELGKLFLWRIVLQLQRAYRRNDKPLFLAATKFITHLINHQVAHEIFALQLLMLLLENPTDDMLSFCPELDLVEQEDQFTHEVSLDDPIDPKNALDICRPNPQYLKDEKAYDNLKKNILGKKSSDDEARSDED
ncbi:hypothetical protein QJS04_geneDACA017705 [Acorus gramineus]|uniref:MIF4G domain-containing protein n=1 Tax=Acorus gramineus TaxID=55184 RepID=A0AAV9BVV0_ACOGR|nr:hypothetical protein QJS04_geneDACA017705 [Acorus gramineus]